MTGFSGYSTFKVVVITDLDILMDFHEQVWGVPVGPVIDMTKTKYRPPRLAKFYQSNVVDLG